MNRSKKDLKGWHYWKRDQPMDEKGGIVKMISTQYVGDFPTLI